jgi:hypothetical protein
MFECREQYATRIRRLPSVDKANGFGHLVLTCAGLSVAGAGFGLLKELVTVFGRLEGKYPLLTGSV